MKKEKLDTSLKFLAKTSFIVLIGLLLSKILVYVYRIVLARYFGPEVYGIFSLAIIILSLIVMSASLGINDGLLRFIPIYRGQNKKENIKYFYKISSKLFLISGIISAIILFIFSDFIAINLFHNKSLSFYLKIFSILIPINLFANLYLNILKSYEKISWYSFIMNILQNIVKLIMLIIFILIGTKSHSALSFSYFIGILSMFVVSYLVCRFKISEIFKKPQLKKEIKHTIRSELIHYSWPIVFLSVLGSLFYWIDSFSIGYFKSAFDVGIYNAAVPIAALFGITVEIFMQLFFPLINKEYSRKNFKLIEQISKQVGKWIFMINLPIILIVIIFPGAIINILFGSEYLYAETALRFLSIGMFFSFILNISGSLLSMIGKSRLILADVLFFSLVNLALNILLIPKFGINGAAFSTMISALLLQAAFVIQTKYYISIIPFRRKMIRIFLVSIIPTLLLVCLKQFFSTSLLSLILQGILFLLIYLFLILLTGCLDDNDFMIIKTIKYKLLNKNYFHKKNIYSIGHK